MGVFCLFPPLPRRPVGLASKVNPGAELFCAHLFFLLYRSSLPPFFPVPLRNSNCLFRSGTPRIRLGFRYPPVPEILSVPPFRIAYFGLRQMPSLGFTRCTPPSSLCQVTSDSECQSRGFGARVRFDRVSRSPVFSWIPSGYIPTVDNHIPQCPGIIFW